MNHRNNLDIGMVALTALGWLADNVGADDLETVRNVDDVDDDDDDDVDDDDTLCLFFSVLVFAFLVMFLKLYGDSLLPSSMPLDSEEGHDDTLESDGDGTI